MRSRSVYLSVSLVISAIWIGALIACVLKLGSAHRSAASWIVACLVGSLGAMLGLFFARMLGFGQEHGTAALTAAGLCAAGLVILWAVISRVLWATRAQPVARATRPTIVF